MDPWEIQADLFESLHAVRFAVLLSLSIVFFSYVLRYRANKDNDGYKAAVAFFVYCSGEAAWRGLVWANHGDQVTAFGDWTAFSTAGVVSAIGSIMCLWAIIPTAWQWQAWSVMIISALIVGGSTLFM